MNVCIYNIVIIINIRACIISDFGICSNIFPIKLFSFSIPARHSQSGTFLCNYIPHVHLTMSTHI